MKRVSSLLALSIAAANALAEDRAQQACGQIVDVPEIQVRYGPATKSSTLYRREHDLLQLFSEGDGELELTRGSSPTLVPGVALYPLPWHVAAPRDERASLLTWHDRERSNDENMLAMVLHEGERFCTSSLEWTASARLRFEAFRVENDGALAVSVGEQAIYDDVLERPRSLNADTQVDVGLEGSSGILCFEASRGAVAIGEPRVLAPEPSSDDPRPRWMVLTIIDALRGDVVRGDDAPRLLPTLDAMRGEGHDFGRAVSPGCHTRASVWPILMGRDLMRIDPLKRRQSMPIQSPLPSIYSRANLFVTHFAQAAGYHPVFLGNNAYLNVIPAFARYSSWGRTDTGTADTVDQLDGLMQRYADERTLLLYYISTPHGQSQTPRRWFEALGCDALEGTEQCRCSYDARVRHADEALRALQDGLEAYGLSDEVYQIVTADHGELFEEGIEREGELPAFATGTRGGAYQRFNLGHGNACHVLESDVPLILHGKGVDEPKRWDRAVSGLDIMPTMLDVLGVSAPSRLDGEVLPQRRGDEPSERALVSYGFCSDSVIDDGEQLLWWSQGCRLREIEGGPPVDSHAEMWVDGKLVAANERTLRHAMSRHETWLVERLPSDAFVFDTANLDGRRITLRVDGGRITDYGPASSVYGLDRIQVEPLDEAAHQLTIQFDGYRGLFHVTTIPPRAPVAIHIEDGDEVLTFIGPSQLPLPETSAFLNPEERPSFFVTDGVPVRRDTERPAIRLWWQRYGASGDAASARALSEFDRVLREWGYIR